jgi:hypothetical protein
MPILVEIKIGPCMNEWSALFYNRYSHYLMINCATMLGMRFLFCSNKISDDDVQL